jgi:hypothetical protein
VPVDENGRAIYPNDNEAWWKAGDEQQSLAGKWLAGDVDTRTFIEKLQGAGWDAAAKVVGGHITHKAMEAMLGKDEADRMFEAAHPMSEDRKQSIQAFRNITKVANPEKFEEFIATQPRSKNIEDRRKETTGDVAIQLLDPRNMIHEIADRLRYAKRVVGADADLGPQWQKYEPKWRKNR